MDERYKIEEIKENEWEIWDEWLAKKPYSTPFSTSWWLKTVCEIFGGSPHIFIIIDEKSGYVGGVALRELVIMGKSIISPSNLSLYMPIVFSEDLSFRDIEDLSIQLGAFLKNRFNIIRNICNTKELYDMRGFQWLGYDVKVRYTAITDLKSFDINIIDRSQKKQIKKAEKEEFNTKPCDDTNIMHNLWNKTFKRQNISCPVSSSELKYLYQKIKDRSSGQGFVTFTKSGEPVSFRICLWSNSNITYDWIAGTDPSYFSLGVASFNVWTTLQYLKSQGFSTFDWCGANIQSIANFKLSFGAKLTPHYDISKVPSWFKIAESARTLVKKYLKRKQ